MRWCRSLRSSAWRFRCCFGGAVIIEQVFSWPGLGLMTMSAISNRDFPVIMGVCLLSAIVVLMANLVTDILHDKGHVDNKWFEAALDVADIIRAYCDRIAFAHIRNVHHFPNGDFIEASHRDCDGDTGILDILKAYHDCGFDGYIRPDHGRQMWDEGPGNVRPGYGLYDRALGATYINGLWEAIHKMSK